MKRLVSAIMAVIVIAGAMAIPASAVETTEDTATTQNNITAFDYLKSKQNVLNGSGNILESQQLKIQILNINLSAEVKVPVFSTESGFYDEAFNLGISSGTYSKIYYTTDGSIPTNKSKLYTDEIEVSDRSTDANVYSAISNTSTIAEFKPARPVTKSTIVRAIAYDLKGNVSDVITKTYFVGNDIAKQYNGVPIISLVTDPDNLFNYDNGIYVKGKVFDDWVASGGDPTAENVWEFPGNYTMSGREWEKPVHMDFFEGDGSLGVSQELGIRIMGNATRSYLQKSFRLYAREEYGKKNIKYDLIPNTTKQMDKTTPLTTFKSVVLRNGGNDNDNAKLRDYFIQTLVRDRNFDTQSGRPAVVFLDGEYWGIYCLQEDYDNDYIKNNYDVAKDDVVMIKNGEIEEGLETDISLYNDMLNFAANNDLSIQENYDKISSMVDIDNLIDYFSTEIYFGNNDWMNYNNNYRAWRAKTITTKPYQDGKWRFMLYDTEYSLALYEENGAGYNHDTLYYAMYSQAGSSPNCTTLFSKLLENTEFKQKFVNTIMDIGNVNFRPETASAKLDEIADVYKPLMNECYARFGPSWILQFYSPPDKYFTKEISSIKSYLSKRYDFVPTMVKSGLKLDGQAVDVNLNINDTAGGTITINTVNPDLSNGSWNGKYFTDCPVTITAVPNDGYTFTGWSGASDSKESTIIMSFSEAISLTANFAK